MGKDKELTAMVAIADTLDQFTEDEHEIVERILRWALSRYKTQNIEHHDVNIGPKPSQSTVADGDGSGLFEDIADLFSLASPKTDRERALVAGYWFTKGENKTDFTGQEVNSSLKHLGHGLKNITEALTSMMNKKPSLVMQTAKSGSSKQARKKYKITRAGLDFVERMISGEGNSKEK